MDKGFAMAGFDQRIVQTIAESGNVHLIGGVGTTPITDLPMFMTSMANLYDQKIVDGSNNVLSQIQEGGHKLPVNMERLEELLSRMRSDMEHNPGRVMEILENLPGQLTKAILDNQKHDYPELGGKYEAAKILSHIIPTTLKFALDNKFDSFADANDQYLDRLSQISGKLAVKDNTDIIAKFEAKIGRPIGEVYGVIIHNSDKKYDLTTFEGVEKLAHDCVDNKVKITAFNQTEAQMANRFVQQFNVNPLGETYNPMTMDAGDPRSAAGQQRQQAGMRM